MIETSKQNVYTGTFEFEYIYIYIRMKTKTGYKRVNGILI